MTTLAGHCHCGAIRVEFEPGRPLAELPLRACAPHNRPSA